MVYLEMRRQYFLLPLLSVVPSIVLGLFGILGTSLSLALTSIPTTTAINFSLSVQDQTSLQPALTPFLPFC